MDTPGSVLKSERAKQHKSLKDIAKFLKINVEYLKAIENDNYSFLPAEIFTKSYIRLYADALSLESDYILQLYEQQSRTTTEKKQIPSERKLNRIDLKKIFTSKVSFITIAIIIICALLVLIISTITRDRKEIRHEPYVSPVDEPVISKEEHADKLELKIIATEITWVSVSMDGDKPKEWLLKPGQTVTLTADEHFSIKVGNAGGTRLIFNDEDIGELGPHGKVIDIVLPVNEN